MFKPCYIIYYDAYEYLINNNVIKTKPMGLIKTFFLKSKMQKDAIDAMKATSLKFFEKLHDHSPERIGYAINQFNSLSKYHMVDLHMSGHVMRDFVAIMHVSEIDIEFGYIKEDQYPYIFDLLVRCIPLDTVLRPDRINTLSGKTARVNGAPMDMYDKVKKLIDTK